MVSREYTVRLESFEGPLDLLLFLIRRAEVDIHDIPIAEITEQYLGYLDQLTTGAHPPARRLDIEQAGEFLVMAATLMEIKSRMLSPRAASASDQAEGETDASPREAAVDPRTELVRQLLEYKRYRDATDRLEEWRSEWDHRYPSARVVIGRPSAEELAAAAASEAGQAEEERVDVDDLQLIDLVEAFARIVESVDFNRVGEHRVVVDDTPVEVHGDRIVQKLRDVIGAGVSREEACIEFRSLFVQRTRPEMIGIFLAILELVKQQRVLVQQDAISSQIVLKLGADSPAAGGGETGPAAEVVVHERSAESSQTQ
jgi:segregation and condensation protein A